MSQQDKADKFYVIFFGVLCFSGMFEWEGALLRIASDQEYLRFMEVMMPSKKIPADKLLDKQRFGQLYRFGKENEYIQLVATNAEQKKKLW
jgi:hypothetical protein